MITIRHARREDVVALAVIGMRAWEQAVTGLADLDRLREAVRDAFIVFLNRQWLTVTVAEKGGMLAGWAAREELDDQITDLWVEPSLQRQGVGTALLEAIEAEMLAADYGRPGCRPTPATSRHSNSSASTATRSTGCPSPIRRRWTATSNPSA